MLLAFLETPQRWEGLTVFPVVAADEPELSYLLLADAMETGVLTISENEPGEPPHLVALNRGPVPVLVLDCETVSRAGCGYASDQSVLLGPRGVTRIPLSCRDTRKWSCREGERRFSSDLSHFPMVEDQVGVLAFMGRQFLGMDALGSPSLYSRLHRRLLTGYLLTAVAAAGESWLEPPAEQDDVECLAWALEVAQRHPTPYVGHGEYTVLDGLVAGGELRHNGNLVHLSVFPRGVEA